MAQIHSKQVLTKNELTKEEISLVLKYVQDKYKTRDFSKGDIVGLENSILIRETKDSSPLVLNRSILH